MGLFAVNNDAKTVKGVKYGFMTAVLYLVPANGSGREFCVHRSPECTDDCLYTAGRGIMRPVAAGRMRKSKLFSANPKAFIDLASHEILKLAKRAAKLGLILVVRMNGTSDLPWENIRGTAGLTLMELHPTVQFYDYTKWPERDAKFPNYHLTFSRSETNEHFVFANLARGRNVAVVFSTKRGEPLPQSWQGFTVVDGDLSDLRFLDVPQYGVGMVIGLRAKGRAKTRTSGFVVQTSEAA
jgi:hypothetical protein